MRWIFLLLPWLELWTLIELGAATTGLAALAWVFFSLILGLVLIRRRGIALLSQLQRSDGTLLGPRLLMDDLALVSSGLLLMVPGLITDTLAVLTMIGPLRRGILRAGAWQVPPEQQQDSSKVTLEGEFHRLDD